MCDLHVLPLKIHRAIIRLTNLVYVNEGWHSITLGLACWFRAQMSVVIHHLPGGSVTAELQRPVHWSLLPSCVHCKDCTGEHMLKSFSK